MNERTITIKGKVYTSMIRRGDHSCDGCHLEGNIHAPCGDEPACEDITCEDDEIWILKEKKNMKQKIEVGMWVRIDSAITQEELNSMSGGFKLTLKEDYEKEPF